MAKFIEVPSVKGAEGVYNQCVNLDLVTDIVRGVDKDGTHYVRLFNGLTVYDQQTYVEATFEHVSESYKWYQHIRDMKEEKDK